MITRLQSFFLKHNKWLFGSLLVVIIVTFVLTIGPQSFFGSQGPQQRQSLKYYGYDLSSEADQRAMAFSAELSAILHPELRLGREQLMEYAYLRVAALGIADQLGIPQPGREALARHVETLRIFQDPATGEFSPQTYQSVLDALQTSARFSRESIAAVLREDYRIARVRSALSGPDYTLLFEARQDFIDEGTAFTFELAHFDFAAFQPDIEPSEEELLRFYNENPGRYETPENLSVRALLFEAAAYLGETGEPSEADLEAHFAANRGRYEAERPAPEEAEEALPELTLGEVRDTVVAEWRMEQAKRIAARKGEQFSVRLWREEVALDSPQFEQLLKEFSVRVREIAPYTREQPPAGTGIPAQLFNSMWIYTNNPKRYFSDIAQLPDGAVVLVSTGLSPARLPAFEEVWASVEADYRRAEKRRLFAEEGQRLRGELQQRIAEAPFAEAAAALGLELETPESFTGATVPFQVRRAGLWDQVQFLEQGAVSPMILQDNRGTFAFVAERSIPEVDAAGEEFLAFVAERRGFLSETMGWARLREISDQSLTRLLGPGMLR